MKKNRIDYNFARVLLTGSLILACFSSCTREANKKNDNGYLVAAYIWPSCHDDPLGHEKLWSEGIAKQVPIKW
ncbi:MAG: hypothetical protein PHI28_09050 [Mangrovibacterium sp.]|nr:hypothetical protein [Mangrovibacterium sp.]